MRLLVNTKDPKCGGFQYMKELQRQTDCEYLEIHTQQDLLNHLATHSYDAILVNYHWSFYNREWYPMEQYNVYYLYHEGGFQFRLRLDKIIDTNPNVGNGLPRPIIQLKPKPYIKNEILTIGTFGLSYNVERYRNVIVRVQEEFDTARIRIWVTSKMEQDIARRESLENYCRSFVFKPTIQIEFIHEFSEDMQNVIDFLGSNDLNVFAYPDEPERGFSSIFDSLLALERPFAICNVKMFQHVYTDLVSFEKRTLQEIMNDAKVIEYIYQLRERWNPETVKRKLNSLLLGN